MTVAQVARAFALPQISRLRHLPSLVNGVRTTPKDHRFLDPRVPDDFDAWKIVQVDLTSLNLKSFRVRHILGTEDTHLLPAMTSWELQELQLGSRDAGPVFDAQPTLRDIHGSLTVRSSQTLCKVSLPNRNDGRASKAKTKTPFDKLEQLTLVDIGPLQSNSVVISWVKHAPSLASIHIHVPDWPADDFLAILQACQVQLCEISWETKSTIARDGTVLIVPSHLQRIRKFVLIPSAGFIFPTIPSAMTWLELSEYDHDAYFGMLGVRAYGPGLTDIRQTFDSAAEI